MIYLYLFGTCFHFIYVFMIIGNNYQTYKGLINDAKVVTEYIRLNSIELRDLEMDIPVYLAQYGCYLAIIEITTKENDICECKLLKL